MSEAEKKRTSYQEELEKERKLAAAVEEKLKEIRPAISRLLEGYSKRVTVYRNRPIQEKI